MNEKSWLPVLNSSSDNLKSKIENPKWSGDSTKCAGESGQGDSMKRMQQAIGIERRRADPVLTDKPVYRDQALADGIDGEEKTFESDGAEQSWTLRRNKTWSRDFIAIQTPTVLRLWARRLAVRLP